MRRENAPRRPLAALGGSPLPMDLLACVLLAAGLSVAVLATTALPQGPWLCLGLAALCTALFALCALRWWVGPALLGLGLAVFFAAGLLLGALGRWLGFLTDFVFWLGIGAPAVPPYAEDGSFALLRLLVVAGISLAAFLLVRRFFFFPLLAGAVAAALAWAAWAGRAGVVLPLCLCALGLIALLPRVYAHHLEKTSARRGRAEAAEGDAGEGADGPDARRSMRARMQLIALAVAAAAVGLAVLITPADTSGWRSATLNYLAEDVAQLFEGPFGRAPSYQANFSVASLGFGQDTGRLGGPVQLGDETLLTVKAPQAVLLKGRVLDVYTGQGWATGRADGDLRYNSLFWRGYRREAFGAGLPLGGGEAQALAESLTAEVELEIRTSTRRYNSLFYAGTLEKLSLDHMEDSPQPYFNRRGELYLHQRPARGAAYTVTARVWNTGRPGFEADMLALEALCARAEDPAWEAVAARYTALPEALPAQVRATAKAITQNSPSPYAAAVDIARWLAESSTYSLEVEMPPEDADFVAHFLQTGEGYCTYYASAMAVLARCAGLPSRYVQGFGLEAGPEAGSYAATGRTAHAWAEVYLRGVGWLPFDALAWDAVAPLNEAQPAEPEEQPGGAAQPQPPPAEPPAEGHGDAGEAEVRQMDWWAVMGVLLGAAAGALLCWWLVRLVMDSKNRAYLPKRVARRFGNDRDRLACYYKDILRQLALAGVSFEPGETLAVFAEGVDRRLRFEGGAFGPVAEAVSQMMFAQQPPTAEQVAEAGRYHRLMEHHLLEKLGAGRYFFRRALPP